MRRLLLVILVLCVAGVASAANLGTHVTGVIKGQSGHQGGGGRQGGENIGSAVVIGSLPYADTGNTSGNVNDYTANCGFATAPDVVYSYYTATDVVVNADLCSSDYDTQLYIFQDGPGTIIACDDDGCGSGLQSYVTNVTLVGGHTYYFIVDGFSTASGNYGFEVSVAGAPPPPCQVVCPAGGVPEGEPTCQDNYIDNYDGGCNSVGWFQMWGQAGTGCEDVCGKSCTYLNQGVSNRDTDWYTATALASGTITATCNAEFALQFIYIYGTDCSNLAYNLLQGNPCQVLTLSNYQAAGSTFWLWVGPSGFTGVPESNYVLHVCGITTNTPPPVPVKTSTWGGIKNQYK